MILRIVRALRCFLFEEFLQKSLDNIASGLDSPLISQLINLYYY